MTFSSSSSSPSITIRPSGPINATIRPPGSKSITNRALLIAALAKGQTVLDGALDSEDTQMMFNALRSLGVRVEHDPSAAQMTVEGCGGVFPCTEQEIDTGNSGTTARFLTAALSLAPGKKQYRIFGKPRMHERPIKDLISGLKCLGANIRSELKNGCPPVLIGSSEYGQSDWNTPGSEGRPIVATISGSISSQFLSAMMMSAPLISAQNDVVLKIVDTLVSRPYIDMTGNVMQAFGVEPDFFFPSDAAGGTITIPQGSGYTARQYAIEPDASAASYFFAAAAVAGGVVTIQGLSRNAMQGDVGFADCLEKMGCVVCWNHDSITVSRDPGKSLCGITIDMNAISDTVQTLGVVALFAEGTTRITNIAHIRHKETDRISALATELRKLGATVDEFDDGLAITPVNTMLRAKNEPRDFLSEATKVPKPRELDLTLRSNLFAESNNILVPAASERRIVEIATYDDHRMAMSFAIAGLREPGITICDPQCTEKTYPRFFQDLAAVVDA